MSDEGVLAAPKDERIVKQLTRIAEALERLERHFQRAETRKPSYTERYDKEH